MSHINRNYIDSHWLVFIFQGVIALLFGCLALFASGQNPSGLFPFIGIFLLALAVVEFANSLYRSHHRQGWVVSVLVAFFDAAFGIAILLLATRGMVWQLSLLSAYTMLRGIFEIAIAFRTTVDPTDRFIWALCGLCGIVFGFVIFNSGHLVNIEFIRFFGAYMMILGVSSLIYGIHNREQGIEAREYDSASTKKTPKSARTATRSKKAGRK